MPLGIVSDEDFNKELENNSVDYSNSNNSSNSKSEPRTFNNTDNLPTDNDIVSGEIVTSDVLQMKSRGRIPEVPNVPQSLRKILGEEHAINGLKSAQHLADSLIPRGLSQPTLSTYGRGQVSNGVPNDDMLNHINGRKIKISKRALNKLNMAVSMIDEQKLLGCDAKELSSVAKDMAIVAKQMEPSVSDDRKSEPVQFHFYAPQIKNEHHYETVVAKDNY